MHFTNVKPSSAQPRCTVKRRIARQNLLRQQRMNQQLLLPSRPLAAAPSVLNFGEPL